MIKVIYSNKETGTTVHGLYLSCSADEVKDYVRKLGKDGYDFPDKLIKEIPSKELDYILTCLEGSDTSIASIVDSFYIACNSNIWQEVNTIDLKGLGLQ